MALPLKNFGFDREVILKCSDASFCIFLGNILFVGVKLVPSLAYI